LSDLFWAAAGAVPWGDVVTLVTGGESFERVTVPTTVRVGVKVATLTGAFTEAAAFDVTPEIPTTANVVHAAAVAAPHRRIDR
jgi:hypothetical protein